jgi:hypothetical protein
MAGIGSKRVRNNNILSSNYELSVIGLELTKSGVLRKKKSVKSNKK